MCSQLTASARITLMIVSCLCTLSSVLNVCDIQTSCVSFLIDFISRKKSLWTWLNCFRLCSACTPSHCCFNECDYVSACSLYLSVSVCSCVFFLILLVFLWVILCEGFIIRLSLWSALAFTSLTASVSLCLQCCPLDPADCLQRAKMRETQSESESSESCS